MYEAVSVDWDDPQTVTEIATTAGEYDYDGVVVRAPKGTPADVDLEAVVAAAGVDVVPGVEIRAENPDAASGAVGNYRTSESIVVVRGGTAALNRFAVETDAVDVLSSPTVGDGDVNHVLARAAADNGVRIEFDLGSVLRSRGGRRVRQIQSLTKLARIVKYYDAPYVVSASPSTPLELRGPRELCALGEVLGLETEWITAGLCEWGRLVERNRRIDSDSFIEPGVERGRYEKDDR